MADSESSEDLLLDTWVRNIPEGCQQANSIAKYPWMRHLQRCSAPAAVCIHDPGCAFAIVQLSQFCAGSRTRTPCVAKRSRPDDGCSWMVNVAFRLVYVLARDPGATTWLHRVDQRARRHRLTSATSLTHHRFISVKSAATPGQGRRRSRSCAHVAAISMAWRAIGESNIQTFAVATRGFADDCAVDHCEGSRRMAGRHLARRGRGSRMQARADVAFVCNRVCISKDGAT